MANAFSKIAVKAPSASKKATKPVAEISSAVAMQVDLYVKNKAELARIEAEQLDLHTAIVEVVRPQQDKLAYEGEFTKSLDVPGKESKVVYVTSDRFSVPQDEESLGAVKELVGKKAYDSFFEVKATITIKSSVAKDDKVLNQIAAACEKAGLDIATIFDKVDKVVAREDLDRHQYELTPDKLAMFRALVRQSSPALK